MFKHYDLAQENYDEVVNVEIINTFDRKNLTALKLNNLVAQIVNPAQIGLTGQVLEAGAKSKDNSQQYAYTLAIQVQLIAIRNGVEVGAVSSASWIILQNGVVDEFKIGFEVVNNPTVIADKLVLRLTTNNTAYALKVRAFVDSETVKVKESDFVAVGYSANPSETQPISADAGVYIAQTFDRVGA
jgi:hypothetical protein